MFIYSEFATDVQRLNNVSQGSQLFNCKLKNLLGIMKWYQRNENNMVVHLDLQSAVLP